MIGRLGKEVDGIIGSSPMIYPLKWTHENRAEILVSAVIGAALGICRTVAATARGCDYD
jgi:hypothetical protein